MCNFYKLLYVWKIKVWNSNMFGHDRICSVQAGSPFLLIKQAFEWPLSTFWSSCHLLLWSNKSCWRLWQTIKWIFFLAALPFLLFLAMAIYQDSSPLLESVVCWFYQYTLLSPAFSSDSFGIWTLVLGHFELISYVQKSCLNKTEFPNALPT